jgi:methylated-DNA-protein-cysteine methyltransferase-like protein
MGTLFDAMYRIVGDIPHGKVASYGQIAAMVGSPRSARTVGWAMRCCPEGLPWHRVVKADGTCACGNFADLQKAMLLSEGVAFLSDGRVDMTSYQWDMS